MHALWTEVARRVVAGVGTQPGDLVQVQDHAGRPDVLQEVLLAVELAGATPWPDIAPPAHLRRLIRAGRPEVLAAWDARRAPLLREVARVLVLTGGAPDFRRLPEASRDAWLGALSRVGAAEEALRLPMLLLAVPTRERARRLGMTLAALEAAVLPALAVPAADLQAAIARMLDAAAGARRLVVRTPPDHTLVLPLADRPWMSDDGAVDADDRARGAIVSNVPAGSVYTTVQEDAVQGQVRVPVAGPARDAVLTFEGGRITTIAAATGGAALARMLDGHTGEPRRVSHLGVGVNPALRAPTGWTIVDEHLPGALFLALGENRYMGGANESSLNVDYVLPDATLLVDDRPIVQDGRAVV